jgi:hypothetical protein
MLVLAFCGTNLIQELTGFRRGKNRGNLKLRTENQELITGFKNIRLSLSRINLTNELSQFPCTAEQKER